MTAEFWNFRRIRSVKKSMIDDMLSNDKNISLTHE